MSYKIINFYKFTILDDLPALSAAHRAEAERVGLIGTILMAPEGINVSLGGTQEMLDEYVAFARKDPRLSDIQPKLSDGAHRPFRKLLVKLKRWIIRFDDELDLPPEEIHAANRITPDEMRKLLEGPKEDVVFVDTRNWYETDYGTFKGAEKLRITKFTEFQETFKSTFGDAKDKRFVFFCTGGVRCEKVVPWAVREGFSNATQLDGGILRYFEEHGSAGYDGSCFVFDRRWLVDGKLTETNDDSPALRIQPKPLRLEQKPTRKSKMPRAFS